MEMNFADSGNRLAIGQVIGAGVAEGTRTIDGQASYGIPIGLNFVRIHLYFF